MSGMVKIVAAFLLGVALIFPVNNLFFSPSEASEDGKEKRKAERESEEERRSRQVPARDSTYTYNTVIALFPSREERKEKEEKGERRNSPSDNSESFDLLRARHQALEELLRSMDENQQKQGRMVKNLLEIAESPKSQVPISQEIEAVKTMEYHLAELRSLRELFEQIGREISGERGIMEDVLQELLDRLDAMESEMFPAFLFQLEQFGTQQKTMEKVLQDMVERQGIQGDVLQSLLDRLNQLEQLAERKEEKRQQEDDEEYFLRPPDDGDRREDILISHPELGEFVFRQVPVREVRPEYFLFFVKLSEGDKGEWRSWPEPFSVQFIEN